MSRSEMQQFGVSIGQDYPAPIPAAQLVRPHGGNIATVLSWAVLAVLCCAVLCCAVLCCAVLGWAVLCSSLQLCWAVLHCSHSYAGKKKKIFTSFGQPGAVLISTQGLVRKLFSHQHLSAGLVVTVQHLL